MRTLVISEIRPWAAFGGAMRIKLVSHALAELGLVDLVVLPHPGAPGGDVPSGDFARVCSIPNRSEVAKTRLRAVRELPAWARTTPYDLVWYNRERSWITLKDMVTGPSVVDVDDVEDVVLQRWLALGRTPRGEPIGSAQRRQMSDEIDWWDTVHRKVADEASVMVFCSEQDQQRFAFSNSVVVPNTYERIFSEDPVSAPVSGPTILFQGLLEWPPNEDAAVWLAEDIAPRVRKRVPDLQLVLAGKPSPRVEALAGRPGTEVTGPVPDMGSWLRSADLVVAPLRVGGGTRIKILEAFAYRVPVVTTNVGAEGLGVEAGVHLEAADHAEDLADGCVRLLTDREAAERMTGAAHALYERRYRHQHAVRQVHEAARRAMGRPSGTT